MVECHNHPANRSGALYPDAIHPAAPAYPQSGLVSRITAESEVATPPGGEDSGWEIDVARDMLNELSAERMPNELRAVRDYLQSISRDPFDNGTICSVYPGIAGVSERRGWLARPSCLNLAL